MGEKSSLAVDVRRSKTLVLKLPSETTGFRIDLFTDTAAILN